MRLLRHGAVGKEKPGILDHKGQVRDLSAVVGDIANEALSQENLHRLSRLDLDALPMVDAGIRIGPCVGAISKIIGVGLNYRDHAISAGLKPPERPVLFMKPPSSICGPYDAVRLPSGSEHLDWEIEVGAVIGTLARDIEPIDSLRHVAGYCIVNDITERAWIERSGQLLEGKGCDTFTPIGPWLVTADEVGDPGALALMLDLNGRRCQDGNSRDMIFDLAFLISHISRRMTLLPGDIITTGTPAGVGMRMKPPVYLRDGDVMRLTVTGLGEQQQRVRAA